MSLTFVPTPLGNLRDITLRALDVLRDCDLLVAEDTRVARKLLSALGLPGKEIWSYREQNAAGATAGILARARDERVAVVSDAGMPGISDPGSALVAAARDGGVDIDVLPGPSAFVTAAVLSGFDLRRLRFDGFAPRSVSERERVLREAWSADVTLVLYESPKRIFATLDTIGAIDPDAPIFLVRELSKKFEQRAFGDAQTVASALERPVRGEIVLVLGPRAACVGTLDPIEIDVAIDEELGRNPSAAAAAKSLSRRGFGDRSTIYKRISERRERT